MGYFDELLKIEDLFAYSSIMSSDTFLGLCAMYRLAQEGMVKNVSGHMSSKISKMIGCDISSCLENNRKTISVHEMIQELISIGILLREKENHSLRVDELEIEYLNNVLWQIPSHYWGNLYRLVQKYHKPLSVICYNMSLKQLLQTLDKI